MQHTKLLLIKLAIEFRKKTMKKKTPDRKNPIVDMGETGLPPTGDNALKVQRFSWESRNLTKSNINDLSV